eukprot:TRINITY_DN7366_c0_g1_i5.p1 TRINITY_DN7366_c0_g1~~TRINITY_DN7366_c0_g1_i5.p1  ORF type:complete len:171 (+),score=7.68 TRINITY_DN7366_c0_g1_i5:145-657(+)
MKPSRVMKCRVPSSPDYLEQLKCEVGWTPGRENIRPSPDIVQKKLIHNQDILDVYASEGDFVLHTIFGFVSTRNNEGKLEVKKDNLPQIRRFTRNIFPYNLPEGTNHYIMWYSYGPFGLTDADINQHINADISKRSSDFDFIWYENPKMTVPTVYHVQVFWRDWESLSSL